MSEQQHEDETDSTAPPATPGEYLWPVAYPHEDGDTIIGLSHIPPVCPT